MSREVRMVPPDWKHPKGKTLSTDFSKGLAEWEDGFSHWQKGEVEDYSKYPEKSWKLKSEDTDSETFEEWYGEKPVAGDYMPEWQPEVATHFMMYETCSEGSPISPAFATPEELARWLEDNGASSFGSMTATYEQWLAMINRGSSIASMVVDMGTGKQISGVAAVSDFAKETEA